MKTITHDLRGQSLQHHGSRALLDLLTTRTRTGFAGNHVLGLARARLLLICVLTLNVAVAQQNVVVAGTPAKGLQLVYRPTIQESIDSACASISPRVVIIPADYHGPDDFINPCAAPIKDFRKPVAPTDGIASAGSNKFFRLSGGWASNSLLTTYWKLPDLFPTWSNINGLELDYSALDGGSNFLTPQLSSKTFWHPLYIGNTSYTSGQKFGIRIEGRHYGVGDSGSLLMNNYCWGGLYISGDEGCESADMFASTGGTEFSGAIASPSSRAATAVTVNLSQGAGTLGANRFLLDITKAVELTISDYKTSATGPAHMVVSSIGFGPSSVHTQLGTAVSAPGIGTVTPISMFGITNTTLLCIGDNEDFEMVYPSAITRTTFTAAFTKPHQASSIVGGGGACGWFVETIADRADKQMEGVTGTLHYVWPVLYSSSETELTVWEAAGGSYNAYSGRWSNSPGRNGGVLYPGAEIVSVQQNGKLSDTISLGPNASDWAASDNVIAPLYPAESVKVGHFATSTYFPSSYPLGNGGIFNILGGVPNGYTFGLATRNLAANSWYNCPGCGGYFNPPEYGYELEGLWSYGLASITFPAQSLIYAGCPSAPTGCNTNVNEHVVQVANGNGSWDYLTYNPRTFRWTLSISQGKDPAYYTFASTGMEGPIQKTVLSHASSYSVKASQTSDFIINTGAVTEVDFTLPNCASGLNYSFYVDEGRPVRAIASGGARIRIASSVGSPNGGIESAETGSAVTLQCIGVSGADHAPEWVVSSELGSWRLD
jgi:hypothetical protein